MREEVLTVYKLLYFVAPDEVDEVLLVVPEDYDQDFAEKTANDYLPGAELESEYRLAAGTVAVAEYRPFVG